MLMRTSAAGAMCVLALSAGATAQSDRTLTHGNVTLNGVLVALDGSPVAGAEVAELEGGRSVRTARTGADGFFELRQLPRGAIDFSIRKLGFKLRTVTLDIEPGIGSLQLVLEPAATYLDTMVVLAKPRMLPQMEAFYARSRLGFGTFLDSAALWKYGETQVTKTITRAPGVFSRTMTSHYNRTGSKDVIMMIGSAGQPCMPIIMMDGVRWIGFIDDEVSLNTVRAIEVYNKEVDVPPELSATPNGCGAIVIWRR